MADQLEVDPSYVSRVARDERQSEIVADALRIELRKVIKAMDKRRRHPTSTRKTNGKSGAKKRQSA